MERGGRVLVGTSEGLHELGTGEGSHLSGCEVGALVIEAERWWALVDGRTVARREGDGPWDEVVSVPDPPATCLGHAPVGLLVGTAGAHLLRLLVGGLVRLDAFETVDGRETWSTPWGDPPDVRSIAVDRSGAIYVNVHVGGVARSTDGGRSWRPTLDVDADAHQVAAHPGRAGHVVVASAVGLGTSEDGGESWTFATEGLHARYCRAVAVADDTVFVSASTGPGGRRAALYRRALAGGPLERCREGLPEWFGDNLDTHCLAARGATVVLGTADGRLYASADGGRSFGLLAKGLPAIRCVALG